MFIYIYIYEVLHPLCMLESSEVVLCDCCFPDDAWEQNCFQLFCFLHISPPFSTFSMWFNPFQRSQHRLFNPNENSSSLPHACNYCPVNMILCHHRHLGQIFWSPDMLKGTNVRQSMAWKQNPLQSKWAEWHQKVLMKKCCVRGTRRIACQELPHFVLEVQIDGVGVPTEDSSLMDCLRSGYCKNIHSINSTHFQKTGMPLCLVFFSAWSFAGSPHCQHEHVWIS